MAPNTHGIDPDVHVVLVACPGYGHVRPLRSLARSLTQMGVSITFITGHSFRQSIESIPGVEFVSLKGVADFDMSRLEEYFPGRKNLPKEAFQFLWDLEHVFFGSLPDQHDVLQGVLKRSELANKKVVLMGDPTYTGMMPMLLGSPGARRVPTIAIAPLPLIFQSKNCAPFGMGLPPQSIEENVKLNAGAKQMLAPVQAALERILEPYNCTTPLRGITPLDDLCWLPDMYLQLSVEALEPPRSDLRPNLRFIGTLLGANDKKEHPEWFQEFVVDDKSDRPLIMVSSGTLPTVNASELIIPTIEACRDMPVRVVVCAVYASKPADFVLPDNARWAEWIPFEELFKYVSMVVTNGGYGGINQAFAAGIPMVVGGVTEDKTETTSRAEATGAAINLRTQTPSTQEVKAAVEKVLRDPTYKEKAMELKKAYADHDAVGSIVQALNEQVEGFYGGKKAHDETNGHV